jgi:hypothetical protein
MNPARQTLHVVVWATVALALAVMAMRLRHAVSFAEPLTGVTSGAEEESALSFWRYLHGRDVYQELHRIPFAASVYNWLYYAFYGEISGFILRTFRLPEVWLLTISRLVTLGWAVAGVAMAWRSLGGTSIGAPNIRALAPPLAIYLFLGPLVGFWAISLNMELAATVCTATAALVIAEFYDRAPVRAIIVATFLSLVAWGFKQTYIYAAGAICLFLLLRRDWKGLGLTLVLHGVVWAVALMLGTEAYFKTIFFIGIDTTLSIQQLTRNLTNVATKTTPVLALVAILPMIRVRRQFGGATILADSKLLIALCGLATTLPLTLVFAAKVGAAENYFFSVIYFLCLSTVAFAARLAGEAPLPVTATALLGAGWAAAGVAALLVLTGVAGVLSVRPNHDQHVAQKACLENLSAPAFFSNNYLALPWMSSSEPRFILSFPYRWERAAGRPFERDGVGGLIREGYFRTIVVSAGAPPEYDGATFAGYGRRVSDCAGLDIYYRTSPG